MYALEHYIYVWTGFVDFTSKRVNIIMRRVLKINVNLLMAEFDRPEVTLCG